MGLREFKSSFPVEASKSAPTIQHFLFWCRCTRGEKHAAKSYQCLWIILPLQRCVLYRTGPDMSWKMKCQAPHWEASMILLRQRRKSHLFLWIVYQEWQYGSGLVDQSVHQMDRFSPCNFSIPYTNHDGIFLKLLSLLTRKYCLLGHCDPPPLFNVHCTVSFPCTVGTAKQDGHDQAPKRGRTYILAE